MKRLWPVLAVLSLALAARAQEPPGDAPADPRFGGEPAAPADDSAQPQEGGGTVVMPADGGDNAAVVDKPAVSAPLFSVKVATPPPEEGDEQTESAAQSKRAKPTATLVPQKKRKSRAAVPVKKGAKTGVAASKPKTPSIPAEIAPPIPAVPLTPITPRNP